MSSRAKIAVALMLTFAAGEVDIVGFLSLYPTFTAHMTGVTVHLGQHVAAVHPHDVAVLSAVLGSFVIGSMMGRSIVELAAHWKLRSAASLTLVAEAALIFVVAISAHQWLSAVATTLMLAAAMGLQTAALTRVGPLTVHTTFVTGMLNKLAQLLSRATFLTFGDKRRERRQVLRQAAFMFSIWLVYFFGAVTGAWMKMHWAIRSLLLPAAIVIATAIIDQVNPLSIEEERDQSER